MKKIILTFGLMCILYLCAYSQWDINGNTIFTKNHKVIIGDSIPVINRENTGLSVISKHDIANCGGNGIVSLHSTNHEYLKFNSMSIIGYTSLWLSQAQCASTSSILNLNKDNASSMNSRSASGVFNLSFDNYTPMGDFIHYLSGSHSIICGKINSYPIKSVISAVIGEDQINSNQTFAGYFIGKGYFSENLGIGVLNPKEKLQIKGNIKFEEPNNGIILKSPNGTEWKITVDNRGVLIITPILNSIELNSIKPSVLESDIKIYPNPSKESINIDIYNNNLKTFNVEFYDLNGKMVFLKNYYSNKITISLLDFKENIYIIKIIDNDGNVIKSEKIIKQ